MSEPISRRGLPERVKMRHSTHFVEQLAHRHETPVGRMVPLASLHPNPKQPRSVMGELDDLVDSIRAHGILEPILVRRAPASSHAPAHGPAAAFEIISGERRYRAALTAGLFEVPVIEMEVSDQEVVEIALIENLQRKDLTPFEEADGYRQLAEQFDYSHDQIGQVVGKSRSSVTETLQLLNLPARVRETAEALGIRTKSTLLSVIQAPGEPEMLQLLERIHQHGLSRDDVRREKRSLTERRRKLSRRKPYVFRFRSPDRSYSLSLAFRQSAVDRGDLIRALEGILESLREKTTEAEE